MQSFDVVIVGGGPAGSATAWAMRDSGLKVAIVDKAIFPREKVCAGWITPIVLQILDIPPNDYARQHVLQPITAFRIGILGQPSIICRYDKVVSYGIRRCEFDDFLLKRSGAELKTDNPIYSIERSGSRWVLNGELMTDFLIGAGGHFCPVRRTFIQKSSDSRNVVTAQEVEFEVPQEKQHHLVVDGATPELTFLPDLSGYGWCFRKGNYLNIGVGQVDGSNLRQTVSRFLSLIESNRLADIPLPRRMQGHAYRLASTDVEPVADEHVVLVGDAAGLAHPVSGEGIRPAIESGLRAGRAIVRALNGKSDLPLEEYSAWVKTRSRRLERGIPRESRLFQCLGRFALNSRFLSRRFVLDNCFLKGE